MYVHYIRHLSLIGGGDQSSARSSLPQFNYRIGKPAVTPAAAVPHFQYTFHIER